MALTGTYGPGQWLTRDPSNSSIGIISSVRPGNLASPMDMQTEADRASENIRRDYDASQGAKGLPMSSGSEYSLATGTINQQEELEDARLTSSEKKRRKRKAQIQALLGQDNFEEST